MYDDKVLALRPFASTYVRKCSCSSPFDMSTKLTIKHIFSSLAKSFVSSASTLDTRTDFTASQIPFRTLFAKMFSNWFWIL